MPPFGVEFAPIFCPEKQRLVDAFTHAVSEYLRMESAQMAAVLDGRGFAFEAERREARRQKERAKRAIRVHEQEHGCGEQAASAGGWFS